MKKAMLYCLVFLITIAILSYLLYRVKGKPFGLILQETLISPSVAETGDTVSFYLKIRNNENESKSFNVTVFCGDRIVGVQEVPCLSPEASIELYFKLNTTNFPTGIYSCEMLIDRDTAEEKLFDLGDIYVEQEVSNERSLHPLSLVLPVVVPTGVVGGSFAILRKRKNKRLNLVTSEEQLPYIFNEILKFEEKTETNTKNTIEYDKKYIS